MPRNYQVTGCSFPGLRERNEDCYRVERIGEWTCGIVVDGIGGGERGADASRMLAESIATSLREGLPNLIGIDVVRERLDAAIITAHETLLQRNHQRNLERKDMLRGGGTATVAAVSPRGEAVIAQFNQPFTYLGVETSVTSVFQPRFLKTRPGYFEDPVEWFLGLNPPLFGVPFPVVSVVTSIAAGGWLVVASDGIQWLSPPMIAAIVREEQLDPATRLCEEALTKGSRDNVTAVAFRGT